MRRSRDHLPSIAGTSSRMVHLSHEETSMAIGFQLRFLDTVSAVEGRDGTLRIDLAYALLCNDLEVDPAEVQVRIEGEIDDDDDDDDDSNDDSNDGSGKSSKSQSSRGNNILYNLIAERKREFYQFKKIRKIVPHHDKVLREKLKVDPDDYSAADDSTIGSCDTFESYGHIYPQADAAAAAPVASDNNEDMEDLSECVDESDDSDDLDQFAASIRSTSSTPSKDAPVGPLDSTTKTSNSGSSNSSHTGVHSLDLGGGRSNNITHARPWRRTKKAPPLSSNSNTPPEPSPSPSPSPQQEDVEISVPVHDKVCKPRRWKRANNSQLAPKPSPSSIPATEKTNKLLKKVRRRKEKEKIPDYERMMRELLEKGKNSDSDNSSTIGSNITLESYDYIRNCNKNATNMMVKEFDDSDCESSLTGTDYDEKEEIDDAVGFDPLKEGQKEQEETSSIIDLVQSLSSRAARAMDREQMEQTADHTSNSSPIVGNPQSVATESDDSDFHESDSDGVDGDDEDDDDGGAGFSLPETKEGKQDPVSIIDMVQRLSTQAVASMEQKEKGATNKRNYPRQRQQQRQEEEETAPKRDPPPIRISKRSKKRQKETLKQKPQSDPCDGDDVSSVHSNMSLGSYSSYVLQGGRAILSSVKECSDESFSESQRSEEGSEIKPRRQQQKIKKIVPLHETFLREKLKADPDDYSDADDSTVNSQMSLESYSHIMQEGVAENMLADSEGHNGDNEEEESYYHYVQKERKKAEEGKIKKVDLNDGNQRTQSRDQKTAGISAAKGVHYGSYDSNQNFTKKSIDDKPYSSATATKKDNDPPISRAIEKAIEKFLWDQIPKFIQDTIPRGARPYITNATINAVRQATNSEHSPPLLSQPPSPHGLDKSEVSQLTDDESDSSSSDPIGQFPRELVRASMEAIKINPIPLSVDDSASPDSSSDDGNNDDDTGGISDISDVFRSMRGTLDPKTSSIKYKLDPKDHKQSSCPSLSVSSSPLETKNAKDARPTQAPTRQKSTPSLPSEGVQHKRSVCFSTLQIRSYERVLEMHPCTKSGPSVGLGWKYVQEESIPIQTNLSSTETNRNNATASFKLSVEERKEILKNLGYSEKEIAKAVGKIEKTKSQRLQSSGVKAKQTSWFGYSIKSEDLAFYSHLISDHDSLQHHHFIDMSQVDVTQVEHELGRGPARFAARGERSIEARLDCLSPVQRRCFDNLSHKWHDRPRASIPDSLLLRFAGTNNFDEKGAWKKLLGVFTRHLRLTCQKLSTQILTKTIFPCPGLRTRSGQDMLYMRPSRYFPNKTSTDTIIDNLVYVMDTMLEKEYVSKDGIGFIANMQGWVLKNYDHGYCFRFMMALQGYLIPVRVKLFLIVNPPTWYVASLAFTST